MIKMPMHHRLLLMPFASLAIVAAPYGCGTEAPSKAPIAPAGQAEVMPVAPPRVVDAEVASPAAEAATPTGVSPATSPVVEVREEVRRAAGSIDGEVSKTKAQIDRDAEAARGEVRRAVSETRGGVQDFAGELRDGASKAADQATGQVRNSVGEVRKAADEAAGGVRKSVDQVKGGVKKAVDGARDEAQRRARAIGKGVEKTGQDLKKEVIEGLLGPSKE